MNEKLQKVLEGILQSEQETSEFSKLQSVDEIYSYFEGKVPGLTRDEFDDFMADIMDDIGGNEEILQNIDIDSLESIAGGANLKDTFKRLGTGAAALFTLIPGMAGGMANAANVHARGHAQTVKTQKKQTPKPAAKPAAKPAEQETTAEPAKQEPKINISEVKTKQPSRLKKLLVRGIEFGGLALLTYAGLKLTGKWDPLKETLKGKFGELKNGNKKEEWNIAPAPDQDQSQMAARERGKQRAETEAKLLEAQLLSIGQDPDEKDGETLIKDILSAIGYLRGHENKVGSLKYGFLRHVQRVIELANEKKISMSKENRKAINTFLLAHESTFGGIAIPKSVDAVTYE